jgi:hypothetical protein
MRHRDEIVLLLSLTVCCSRPVAPSTQVSVQVRRDSSPAVEWRRGRQVATITIQLLREQQDSPYRKSFDIERDKFEQVLKALAPTVPLRQEDAAPINSDFAMGIVVIRYSVGSEDKIAFYDAGKNPLVFTINNQLYVRGGRDNPNLWHEQSEMFARLHPGEKLTKD